MPTTAAASGGLTCAGCGNPLTGQQRKWCGPDCQRNGTRAVRLMLVFALTPDEYDQILALQDGKCAVCRRVSAKALVVDHDHGTGYVRGLLCGYCNLRIVGRHRHGDLLRAAADYLTDPPARRALGRDVIAPGRPPKKRKPRRKKAAR